MGFLALSVSAINLGLYLCFYTAYSKANKKLDFDLLTEVLTVRKSLNHTLVELNKAISLAGLTNLCLAMLFATMRKSLLWHAMLLLWSHTAYSIYKFYGSDHIPRIETWTTNPWLDFRSDNSKAKVSALKKVAVVFGLLGQFLLAFSSLAATTLVAAVAHFYTIELDYKLSLKVRPYA
ncbi:hypothetical protein CTAYLR_003416 [Chrysophaeum taylorii]|uniref:Uncharacterized protein n=1 Tax=Chrysophaeum taylorii TaxID=2483200 RepID=A0AAD7UA15_9STRA|nr:hypothetical protein CTAYLR_003416 [Chrysophaeum taylorii]